MAKLLALQGTGNVGKTTTLRLLIDTIRQSYPSAHEQILIQGKRDTQVVFDPVKKMKIGIETQGDPNSRLEDSLEDFKNMKCDVIFCACRTDGMTVKWVKALATIYTIEFVPQMAQAPSTQAAANANTVATLMAKANI